MPAGVTDSLIDRQVCHNDVMLYCVNEQDVQLES